LNGDIHIETFGDSEDVKIVVSNDDSTEVFTIREDEMDLDKNVKVWTKKGDDKTIQVIIKRDIDAKEPAATKKESKEQKIEISQDLLKVYPNPNQGNFTIEYYSEEKNDLHVKVLNTNGEVYYKHKERNFSGQLKKNIQLKDPKPGTYLLNLVHGATNINQKLIVN
jgi:hypothetical protein